MSTDDIEVIRSIAVHRTDVCTALEATLRSTRDVVLRITPPFSGRMRARIHDRTDENLVDTTGGSSERNPSPAPPDNDVSIHIPASDLVTSVPPYPDPDETRNHDSSTIVYDPIEHHDRHVQAVTDWRDAVRDRIARSVTLGQGGVEHEVRVKVLG